MPPEVVVLVITGELEVKDSCKKIVMRYINRILNTNCILHIGTGKHFHMAPEVKMPLIEKVL